MIEGLVTDPRIFSALSQRVSTPIGLPWHVENSGFRGGLGASARAVAAVGALFERTSVSCPQPVQESLVRDAVMAGVGIAQIHWVTTPEAWIPIVEPWPLAFTRWDSTARQFVVTTTKGEVPIEHGQGKWIILTPNGPRSWMYGALRALSEPWSDRQLTIRYRSQHAGAHGSPTPVGTLPEGISTDSKEGSQFLAMLRQMREGRIAALKPFGSEIAMLEAHTNAADVFGSIISNETDDIVACLLGQDGTAKKGSVYTAPVFDGVRFDLVERDVGALDAALTTGLVEWFVRLNFDERAMPSICHVVPDPEEDGRLAAKRARYDGFFATWRALQGAGFVGDQPTAERLAHEYGIESPMVAVRGARPEVALTPSDLASVVTVNEARASAGLGPLVLASGERDPSGDLLLADFRASKADTIAALAAAEDGAPANGEGAGAPADSGAVDDGGNAVEEVNGGAPN